VKPLPSGYVDGRLGLTQDVCRILAAFRADHGWQPGYVWNPYVGTYVSVDLGRKSGGK
jgi:hypothetical protein